ncbi:MAG: FtsH protease activity modulator HflK [Gammaproteobacteria bacterium]|nr:FtsH protease activity modulator HflK [Gammaproteobacteria bacterium]MCW5584072.1 FtsH protease activity modulator HflK [Gammaproteobacteria bacterium]
MSENDPWGRKNDSNLPNFDKALTDFVKKLQAMLTSKKQGNNNLEDPSQHDGNNFTFIFIFIAFLVIWALSGLYIVNPAENAVVLRFGKYIDVMPPGLHWIARFIDTKYLIDIQKIYSFSIDGDFLTKSSDQSDLPNQYAPVNAAAKTNDNINDQSKNLVNVELNVQYRINDPRAYLFNIVSPNETVQQVAAGALSAAIGQMKLDDALTTGREFLSSKVFEATKQILTSYQAGIEVVAVTLKKVQAPDQVRAAFNDVNRADQDKATYIQQAQAYASKVIPLAQGMAARTLADATGYRQKVVLTAQANIAKYQALLKVYLTSPEVTRERMYLETIQSILSQTTKILVDFNTSNNMLYLPLDKLLQQNDPEISANVPQPVQMAQGTSAIPPATYDTGYGNQQ